jgi:hypothetical protein
LDGGHGVRYFREDALFKLVSNCNKVISDLGHSTILELLTIGFEISKIFNFLCG